MFLVAVLNVLFAFIVSSKQLKVLMESKSMLKFFVVFFIMSYSERYLYDSIWPNK